MDSRDFHVRHIVTINCNNDHDKKKIIFWKKKQ